MIDKSLAIQHLKIAFTLQILLLIGVYFSYRYQLKIDSDPIWLVVGLVLFSATHIFLGLAAKALSLNGLLIGLASAFWPLVGGCIAIGALHYKLTRITDDPQYEPDDGPLTDEQLDEIERRAAPKLARLRKLDPTKPRSVSSSLFGITG